MEMLTGKRGIVAGLANDKSIAFACMQALVAEGAETICTYGHPKAGKFIEPYLPETGVAELLFCDVQDAEGTAAVFKKAEELWGGIDFFIHSIAFAQAHDLHGRLVDSSADGFSQAMDISCHSFIRMAKLAEPLLNSGGALITMSYLGADRVVPHYGLMGPVKAALESSVRYLAHELGSKGIRVHAISPGPLPTRAASGIEAFDELQEHAQLKSPLGRLATLEEVGNLAAFLVSDKASGMTGEVLYVDAGSHVIES